MISRRAMLAFAALPTFLKAAGRGTVVAPALALYDDLATELRVTRLTDPAFTSILPKPSASAIARKGNFLLFASDLSGKHQAYRMDLKKGEARQLADAESLEPRSLCMLPGENGYCYLDGSKWMSAGFSGTATRILYKAAEGFDLAPELHVSSDGLYVALVERRNAAHRLRLVNIRSGVALTIAESPEPIRDPLIRPRRASVLYRNGDTLFLSNFDGKQNYRLRTAKGAIVQAQWSPDGRTVTYLHVPDEPGALRSLREFMPDTNEDRAVASTTQFAAFSRNADGSVFVGASGSKASPYVLLLVRTVKRELTLCEHRASDAASVAPQFSPNSQQVFFSSDLHGKPAIYRIDVGRLVSDTEDAEALYK